MTSYSNHINSISTNPGAFPRSVDNQYPLAIDRTKELTQRKCNIWRACVKEATLSAAFYSRPLSLIPTESERNQYALSKTP